MTPDLSSMVKIPPITSRKMMTAISVPFPSAPSTSSGESIHFQNGMPCPAKLAAYAATIKAKMTAIDVMKERTLMFNPFSFLSLSMFR